MVQANKCTMVVVILKAQHILFFYFLFVPAPDLTTSDLWWVKHEIMVCTVITVVKSLHPSEHSAPCRAPPAGTLCSAATVASLVQSEAGYPLCPSACGADLMGLADHTSSRIRIALQPSHKTKVKQQSQLSWWIFWIFCLTYLYEYLNGKYAVGSYWPCWFSSDLISVPNQRKTSLFFNVSSHALQQLPNHYGKAGGTLI